MTIALNDSSELVVMRDTTSGRPVRSYAYSAALSRVGTQQAGQGLVETLVAMLALATLMGACVWLARVQYLDIKARHAVAWAAFDATRLLPAKPARSGGQVTESLHASYGVAIAEQPLLATTGSALKTDLALYRSQVALPYPAISSVHRQLATELWTLSDTLHRTHVRVPILSSANNPVARQWGFDAPAITLERHQSILLGAGHASSDQHTVARLQQADHVWSRTANHSALLGQRLDKVMSSVDSAWHRAALETDWLTRWQHQIPERHILPTSP